jgi:hypothetical protein
MAVLWLDAGTKGSPSGTSHLQGLVGRSWPAADAGVVLQQLRLNMCGRMQGARCAADDTGDTALFR